MNIYHLLSPETTPLNEIQLGNVLYYLTTDNIPKTIDKNYSSTVSHIGFDWHQRELTKI